MSITSLPSPIKVEAALYPTQVLSLTQTWTDISDYVMSLGLQQGAQHYLDRIESSSLNLTLDNRDGTFYSIHRLTPRIPIRVTAWIGGTQYPIFWGNISSVDPVTHDALNTDLQVAANDRLKFLSLRNLWNPGLYRGMVLSSSANHWYRCDTANATNVLIDEYGDSSAVLEGSWSASEGVLLYDKSKGLDLTAGTDSPAGWISVPSHNGSVQGIEFWTLGANNQGSLLLDLQLRGPGASAVADIRIDANGGVYSDLSTGTSANICDGQWHHIALIIDHSNSNKATLLVDGIKIMTSALGYPSYYLTSGSGGNLALMNGAACYVDEIVTSGSLVTSSEIITRYKAGVLLRRDGLAADFIAQALVVAGFPYSQDANKDFIPSNYTVDWDQSGSAPAYVPRSTYNGSWMWGLTSSTIGSQALDTIFGVTDSEIGTFFQSPGGTFIFQTRGYLYRPDGNSDGGIWSDRSAQSSINYEPGNLNIVNDDVDVWTTVTISPVNGDEQTYQAPSSVSDRYGWATLNRSNTMASSIQGVARQAEFLGLIYSSPLSRVQSVLFRSTKGNGYLLPTMLGTHLRDRIFFSRQAPGADIGYTWARGSMIVEAINHSFSADPGIWETTFTLDPYPVRPLTQWPLLLDSPGYGKIDQGLLG